MWTRGFSAVKRFPIKYEFSRALWLPKFPVKGRMIRTSAVVPASALPLRAPCGLTSGRLSILTAVKKFQRIPEELLEPNILQRLVLYRGCACIPIDKEMEKHCIVPDVVPVGPKKIAKVSFPCGVIADMGNELTPTQVKCAPDVTWDADPKAFYTICMTDPDAPSRADPKFREWHHWLVGNIPGTEVCRGEVLSAYVGSGPPPETGLHRYVILIYKQPKKICFEETRLSNNSADGRCNFKIAEFAKKHNLGDPIAGNFYQAEYDDYVPELYKQLGA